MTSADITFQSSPSEFGMVEIPMRGRLAALAGSFNTILNSVRTVQDKEWLNTATDEARTEMISDVDEIAREARTEIARARKLIGWRKYLNPFRAIWQLTWK
jgi:hypothetical protein